MDSHTKTVVVRTPNWLGDTVMALPALAALRAFCPGTRITVVGRWATLLAGQGVADILLPYARRWQERLRLARSLSQEPADLAILLVNSVESALAASGWGARRRLGFDTDGRRRLLTEFVPLPSPRLHQIDEYAALLRGLGVPVSDDATPAWRVPPRASGDAEIDALLQKAGLGLGDRIVGLHLGAAFGPSKLWPAESFGWLAARLRREGWSPVLLGTRDDEATALAVSAAAGAPVASLVGRDHPALLTPLLSRLSCLVSGDTGVAHLAAALGAPTVTIFGPTDPQLTAPRGRSARVVVRRVPCSPCFQSDCPIDHVCLRGIDPEEVLANVRAAVET